MRVLKPHIYQSINIVMIGIKGVILLLHSSNTFCQNKKGPFTHLPNTRKGVAAGKDRNPVIQLQLQIEESYKLGSNLPLLRQIIILYLLSLPVHCVSLCYLSKTVLHIAVLCRVECCQ